MQCNATTEWWQVLTQTGVLLVYLQRDVISAGQTLTHGGEGHLLDVPDALVDAVDGLVTLPLPRGLVPVTTEEMSLLQGCRINAVFFSLKELDFSIQSRYCTLQYHKTGESVQMWVFLLVHTHTRTRTRARAHTHAHTSSDWLIWEDSVWRAARWAASVTVEKTPSLISDQVICMLSVQKRGLICV